MNVINRQMNMTASCFDTDERFYFDEVDSPIAKFLSTRNNAVTLPRISNSSSSSIKAPRTAKTDRPASQTKTIFVNGVYGCLLLVSVFAWLVFWKETDVSALLHAATALTIARG